MEMISMECVSKGKWPRGIWLRRLFQALVFGLVLFGAGAHVHASVALLMEEGYGEFGAMNPTGHAAVYLNHVCAETPTQLRMCRSGELGVVISRYHKMDGYDWIAMPLIPYLYAVDNVAAVPMSVDKATVARLRDDYRRGEPTGPASGNKKGGTTEGGGGGVVGAVY